MPISFADITNKVINWIKTNGNREITAEQLNEILIDVINALIEEVPEGAVPFLNEDGLFEGGPLYDKTNTQLSVNMIALQFGAALVNYIHNSGAFLGTASRALVTKAYHDKFHKTNQWADISVTVPLDPIILKAGDVADGQTLVLGQTMLFIHPTSPELNGIYIVGEEDSVLIDTYSNDFDFQVVILSPKEDAPSEYVILTNNNVRTGRLANEIPKYIKVASQTMILNN